MFEQIELVEQPKLDKDQNPCSYSEDKCLFTSRLVAVIDGVTSKAKRRIIKTPNKTGQKVSNTIISNFEIYPIEDFATDSQWLVHTITVLLNRIAVQRIKEKLDDPKEILQRLADGIIEAFNKDKAFDDYIGKHEHPAASLLLAYQHLQDENKYTFVSVGDGYIFYKDKVIRRSPTRKKIEEGRIQKLKDDRAKGIMSGREELLGDITRDFYSRNNPDSYPAVDISHDWIEHPETRIVEATLEPNDRILMTTDGLTRLIDMYNMYDLQQFRDEAFSEGLGSMVDLIRRIETGDWNMEAIPRYKNTDDICAVMVGVESMRSNYSTP